MHEAWIRADFGPLTILGHNLRGSGGRALVTKPSPTSAPALEQAAESADTDASRKWVGDLSSYLDRVEIISG